MTRIKKRTLIICLVFLILFIYASAVLLFYSGNQSYVEVVNDQSRYSVELASSRGIIYDCNGEKITDRDKEIIAVCAPTAKALFVLKDICDEEFDTEQIIREGVPFTVQVRETKECEDIEYFTVDKRYSDNLLCSNLLGYIDGSGKGVCGVEKAFDSLLYRKSGIEMIYTADAMGRMISGEEKKIINSYESDKSGVALTIDSSIQEYCQKVGRELTKGAIVVLSIPDGKIKAMVSVPTYNPNKLEALSGESPLVNRALSAYSPGSVFKLVIAAAALEENVDVKDKYYCVGSTISDGLEFNCYGKEGHGLVNLHTALQKSCNCYFINLSKKIPVQTLYETALNGGFGTETELYNGFGGDSGSLTDSKNLSSPRALSNFSIGQGDVTVTPLQMAAYINVIASGGKYTAPTVFEGEVDLNGKITKQAEGSDSVSVMEELVALRLKGYMESAVKYGTAKTGYSEKCVSGAKTGTAETGKNNIFNYWYCGYTVSDNNHQYAIVVLNEGAESGNNPTGEVFKNISEFLTDFHKDK